MPVKPPKTTMTFYIVHESQFGDRPGVLAIASAEAVVTARQARFVDRAASRPFGWRTLFDPPEFAVSSEEAIRRYLNKQETIAEIARESLATCERNIAAARLLDPTKITKEP